MNLLLHLHKDKLDSLGYDTVYLEKPIPDIMKGFNWKNLLSPPPNNLSKITQKELLIVAESSQNRSPQEVEMIKLIDQDLRDPFRFLVKKYNLYYPEQKIESYTKLFRPILANVKAYWNRPRPNQLAEYFNLKIDVLVTDTHHTAAYPSGHTVYSKLIALILEKEYPQIDQNKLNNLVNQTARARVLQGVHYPSDNNASLIFSTKLFNYINDRKLI
jgi:hypothetical protein